MKNTWHKHDQRKMTPPFRQFLLLEKQSEQVILSLSSVDFGYGFEIIFGRLHASYFVAELFMSLTLPCSELFCFAVNSKLFSPFFCR